MTPLELSALAKKAAAFFRISRSSRRTLFSLRSLRSSSRSSVVRPARSPTSMSACTTQRRSESGGVPTADLKFCKVTYVGDTHSVADRLAFRSDGIEPGRSAKCQRRLRVSASCEPVGPLPTVHAAEYPPLVRKRVGEFFGFFGFARQQQSPHSTAFAMR